MKVALDEIKFDDKGLVPVVVQDLHLGQVLTLAYMNAESLRRTIGTRESWFWSRSRSSLWHKGETSGCRQRVHNVLADCDRDALLVLVTRDGPACHTGEQSCFHANIHEAGGMGEESVGGNSELGMVLNSLYDLVESRKRDRPAGSYTAYLFDEGLDKILKKVAEEAGETIIAAKNQDRELLTSEAADLLYHLIVLMVDRGITLGQIGDELVSRRNAKDAQ